ncbi:hypothetical protein HC891_07900 [Candidatus Gracilibacteria bacterium]|nr:hypothetical protein [Candidatus Gracilibacteria bacterium]
MLHNACKFTSGGHITITLCHQRLTTPSGSDELLIMIRDSGIGMSAEFQSQLFGSFSQADVSTTRHYGGIGLGLTLSRRLCWLLGGDITVESTPDAGSCFTVHLPFNCEPHTEPAAALAQRSETLRHGATTAHAGNRSYAKHSYCGRGCCDTYALSARAARGCLHPLSGTRRLAGACHPR